MSLDLIRRRHKWLTRVVLVVVSVTFILGIGSFVTGLGGFTSSSGGSAAEINGEEISFAEYNRLRANMRRQYAQQGSELPQAAIDYINMTALNQLIEVKLLAQKARELGYRVSDQELDESIRSNPGFQIDGQFIGTERYQEYIEKVLNENVTAFEESQKEILLAQKFLSFIDETIIVTDEKLFSLYNVQNETVNLNYIEFSNKDISDSYTPTDEEIERYYQGRKSTFRTQEQRQIRYIVLDPEIFEKNIQVSDEELNAYYNAYTEEFLSEDGEKLPYEEVKSDVESKLKSQKGEVARQEILESIELAQGSDKSVDQIAKENGIESVNESGPLLKSQRTGDIPPQIINGAFNQPKGETSMVPVGTTIWVMEVSEISEPREKTLDETKPEIIVALKDQSTNNQTRKKANETLKKLQSVKKEEIAAQVEEMGVQLEETGPFTRLESMPKINLEQIKTEVFEIDEDSTILGKVYQNNDSFYVVIFKEKISADPEAFEEQREELEEQELQTQRRELMQKWLQNLRREAKIVTNNNLFPAQG